MIETKIIDSVDGDDKNHVISTYEAFGWECVDSKKDETIKTYKEKSKDLYGHIAETSHQECEVSYTLTFKRDSNIKNREKLDELRENIQKLVHENAESVLNITKKDDKKIKRYEDLNILVWVLTISSIVAIFIGIIFCIFNALFGAMIIFVFSFLLVAGIVCLLKLKKEKNNDSIYNQEMSDKCDSIDEKIDEIVEEARAIEK
jgi:hypothetical protein